MFKLIPTTITCLALCLSALIATGAQAADSFSELSEDELWFLVDTGQMDEAEALILLDARRQEFMTAERNPTYVTQGVSGLDLGSGRIKSASGLDLGNGQIKGVSGLDLGSGR